MAKKKFSAQAEHVFTSVQRLFVMERSCKRITTMSPNSSPDIINRRVFQNRYVADFELSI